MDAKRSVLDTHALRMLGCIFAGTSLFSTVPTYNRCFSILLGALWDSPTFGSWWPCTSLARGPRDQLLGDGVEATSVGPRVSCAVPVVVNQYLGVRLASASVLERLHVMF